MTDREIARALLEEWFDADPPTPLDELFARCPENQRDKLRLVFDVLNAMCDIAEADDE